MLFQRGAEVRSKVKFDPLYLCHFASLNPPLGGRAKRNGSESAFPLKEGSNIWFTLLNQTHPTDIKNSLIVYSLFFFIKLKLTNVQTQQNESTKQRIDPFQLTQYFDNVGLGGKEYYIEFLFLIN